MYIRGPIKGSIYIYNHIIIIIQLLLGGGNIQGKGDIQGFKEFRVWGYLGA